MDMSTFDLSEFRSIDNEYEPMDLHLLIMVIK